MSREPTPLRYGDVVELSPGLRRITQNNPGPFTGPGTNTFLVGAQHVFIFEPGQEDDAHFEAIVEAIGDAEVVGVVPSHAHADHWPLAPRLAAHFQTLTLGFAGRAGFAPDLLVEDEMTLHAPGVEVTAIHTPGHASDHLCYLLGDGKTLLSGDHVMGWSTSIIAPPDGSLNDYLASLDRLLTYPLETLHPAHGPPVLDARRRIEEIRDHRKQRTRQVLEVLESGEITIPEMVDRIYAGLPEPMKPAAQLSLLAHLLALLEDGAVMIAEEAADPMTVRYRRR